MGGTTNFTKPGATAGDWTRDYDICAQRGASMGAGNPLLANSVTRTCLKEKGWTPE